MTNIIKFKSISKFKKITIIIVGILLLCVVAYFAISIFLKAPLKKAQDLPVSVNIVNDVKKEAESKINSGGDAESAFAVYDKAILANEDKIIKSDLLISKAVLAANSNKLDIALESAKKAVDLDRNGNSLGRLAWIYKRSGDKVNAIKYYTEAADFIDKKLNSTDSNSSNSFRKQVKELGAN